MNGIEVNRGSNAIINNVTHATGGSGIVVYQLAFGGITANTIQDNTGAGILVVESSTTRRKALRLLVVITKMN